MLSDPRVNLEYRLGADWIVQLVAIGPSGTPLPGAKVCFRVASQTQVVFDGTSVSADDGSVVIAIEEVVQTFPCGVYDYEIRAYTDSGEAVFQQTGQLVASSSLFQQFPFTTPRAGPAGGDGVADFSDPDQSGLSGH